MNKIRLLLIYIIIFNTILISKDYNSASHTVKIIFPKIASFDIKPAESEDVDLKMFYQKSASKLKEDSADTKIRLDITTFIYSED